MQLLSPRNMDLIQILLLLGLVTIIWALKPRKKKNMPRKIREWREIIKYKLLLFINHHVKFHNT